MRKTKSKYQQKTKNNRGPLLVLVGGVALLLLAVFFALRGNTANPSAPPPNFTPEAKGGGHLKVDRDSVDLGNVALGQTVQVSFTVTNTGDQPLQFKEDPFIEVKEGC